MKYSELQLHPHIRAGIESNNFVECTDIQERAIPHILEGKDIAGLAQTGTGKTAAFLIPLLDRILWSQEKEVPEEFKTRPFNSWRRNNFILALVPTRELAEQVYTNFNALKGPSDLKAVAVYGGTSYEPQKQAFKDGVDVVIATPGRLIDLFKDHVVDLGQVKAIIFDEADRMFDMGFKDDMKYILQRIPKDRQFLVFSATLNFEVLEVAYEFGAHPVEVNISRDQAKADNVQDDILHVSQDEKAQFLLSLLKKFQPKQAIIFSNFRHNVDRVSKFLSDNGFPAMGISSLLTQAQRQRVMDQFREENDKNILIATDLAARGLDVKGVDMVVNFELPDDAENYVHRIGRTGRASAKGRALSLVSDKDVEALQRIESFLGHKINVMWLEDGEIVTEFQSFPEDRKRSFDRSQPRSGGPRRDQKRGDQRGQGPRRDRNDRKGPKQNWSKDGQRDKKWSKDGQRDQQRDPQKDQMNGQKKQFSAGDGKQQHRYNDNKKHHSKNKKRDGYRSRNSKQGPYTHKPQQSSGAKSKGVGASISGFFKKLFG